MRLVIALALAAAAAPALAQRVSTAPLAAREVLLEIDAIGAVRTPADRTVLLVQLQATGANAAAARADLAAREERLVAAAVAAGVARSDIGEPRSDGLMGLVNNEALVQAGAGQAGPEEEQTARKSLEVAIVDRSAIERIRAALETAGGRVTGPSYMLTDDIAARQAARARALTRARADADAYARSLGMRVGRIVRVSERATMDTASADMVQTMMRRFMGSLGGPDPDIETSIRVSVDFALLPQ